MRLTMAFRTGPATREFAQRYAIYERSVLKLLREHGVKQRSRYAKQSEAT